MQDRFRYRVFDNDDRKMHDVIFLNYENNSVEWYNDKNKKRAAFIEEVPTAQCTGLKDKTDKLIYEGNIVKLSSGAIGFIVFECQAYAIRFSKKDKYRRVGLGAYQSKELEIIGNIYENQELLKEEEQCQ